MKFRITILLILLSFCCFGQQKHEREHRIKKSQFPIISSSLLPSDKAYRQIRYYKEIDSFTSKYTIKFKVDKLRYHMDFNKEAVLERAGFRINKIDIPEESFDKILRYLKDNFTKVKVRRIYQEYPVNSFKETRKIIFDTFQNLILPTNQYRLLVTGKLTDKKEEIALYFDAEGYFLKMQKAPPANYDHVLY